VAGWRTVLTLSIAMTACAPAPRAPKPTDEVPPSLLAKLEGRPALVTFWATWCDACRTEMPALTKLDGWAREHGAVVVGVAVGEPEAKVTEFVAAKKLAYPQLVDEDFHVADALGERRVPATLVVDHTGRVVYRGGALDERARDAFEAAITSRAATR
jgi:peroxiredoxin